MAPLQDHPTALSLDFQFIPKLHAASVIDAKVFVIYHHDVTYQSEGYFGNETLQFYKNESYIEFGTPANISDFYLTPLETNAQFWQVPVLLTNFITAPAATKLRFDSSAQYIYVGTADLEKFKEFLLAPQCSTRDGMIACACTDNTNMDSWFPLLSIYVGTLSDQMELVLKGSGYMSYN